MCKQLQPSTLVKSVKRDINNCGGCLKTTIANYKYFAKNKNSWIADPYKEKLQYIKSHQLKLI